jgi:hypothetical protein
MSAPRECASWGARNGEAVFTEEARAAATLHGLRRRGVAVPSKGCPRNRSFVAPPIGPRCGCVGRRYSSTWPISGCRRHELGDRSCPAGDDRSQSLRAVLGRTNHDYEVSRRARSGG